MSALTQYIAKANAACKRGARTHFQLFDLYKKWRAEDERDGAVWINMDGVTEWGYWDFAGAMLDWARNCERFGFTPVDVTRLVHAHITDGPWAMVPVEAADELLACIDRYLAEFGERLEKEEMGT